MTIKNKKTKPAPPSRLRYESNNPTVSARVSRGLKSELDVMGRSMAEVLQAGLDR